MKLFCRSATCPKCRETCRGVQRIHIDFISDSDLACAQTKERDIIKTLLDTIESLATQKRIAEQNLQEIKQLTNTIQAKRMRSEIRNLQIEHAREMHELLEQKADEIFDMHIQLHDLKQSHKNDIRKLREQSTASRKYKNKQSCKEKTVKITYDTIEIICFFIFLILMIKFFGCH